MLIFEDKDVKIAWGTIFSQILWMNFASEKGARNSFISFEWDAKSRLDRHVSWPQKSWMQNAFISYLAPREKKERKSLRAQAKEKKLSGKTLPEGQQWLSGSSQHFKYEMGRAPVALTTTPYPYLRNDPQGIQEWVAGSEDVSAHEKLEMGARFWS